MRRFYLNRVEDETGVSGVGIVAEGCMFTNGRCVLQWQSKIGSLAIFDSVQDVKTIHGHNGSTTIEWVDEQS